MRGEEDLIPIVMRLRGSAPQAWDEFVGVIRRMAAIKATELVRSPTETIHQMQGQARAWEELAQILLDAPKRAVKAEEIRDGRARAAAQPGARNAYSTGN